MDDDSKPLIVDVGMHRGDDTDFYLRKGFRVLAIEADPDLVRGARTRFASWLETGELEILHVAISDRSGTIPFFRSSREGWGSIDAARAGSATGAQVEQVEVPARTFSSLMADYPAPHYVKVDIEGADRVCIEDLCTMQDLPAYVSFEADLSSAELTAVLIDRLTAAGYHRFQIRNQALNPDLKCPSPAREGSFVDARFTHEMSGLFGRELPDAWQPAQDVKQRLSEIVAQQRLRTSYASTGRIGKIPLGSLHSVLRSAYNLPPVRTLRRKYAAIRGREVGGWFDVHAELRR